MPRKRRHQEEKAEEEETNQDLKDNNQGKRTKLTTPDPTVLFDLPLELHEHILLNVVIAELKDRKIFRKAWEKSADRVVERLRNVCTQWNALMTSTSFRNRLEGIIKKYPELEVCFKVLVRRRVSNGITMTALNDEIFLLTHEPQRQTYIKVYALNDLHQSTRRSIHLPDIAIPWGMVACSVNACLYVLHQTPRGIAIVHVSKVGQQWQVAKFTDCSTQLFSKMCLSVDGRLIVYQGPVPSTISVYNGDGTLQRQVALGLVRPISSVHSIISKSNGNVILVTKTNLTEFDGNGKALHDYKKPSGEFLYAAVDQNDRIATVNESGGVRLLDSEFHSAKFDYALESYQILRRQFHRVCFHRQRNVFLSLETAAFCNAGADQCLSTFDFAEQVVQNKSKKKQKPN